MQTIEASSLHVKSSFTSERINVDECIGLQSRYWVFDHSRPQSQPSPSLAYEVWPFSNNTIATSNDVKIKRVIYTSTTVTEAEAIQQEQEAKPTTSG
ncbi:hypothetical protein GJ496_000655 [Pomphorhynchus laevis]|nr:hypothetical protein GJ496_000655 [Pomphorhynchus laevis]